jgi:hypothetical protein
MTEGKRPGGLTALAVFNFIFGGYDVLKVLSSVVIIVLLATYVPDEPADSDDSTNAEAQEESGKGPPGPREAMAEQWRASGLGVHVLYIQAACYLVLAFLLIASGVGFLKLSRVWGRVLGNVYGVASIGTTAFEVSQIPEDMGGFTILAILAIIYPVLVLILLNTTFKEDFLH